MPANSIITVRKGTASQWNSTNPVLASGEPGYDLTNNILKIGDGVSNWNNLKNVASISGLITASSGNFNSLSVSGISVSVSGHTHSSSDITDLGSLATKNSIKISDIISDLLGRNYYDGGSADEFLAQIEGNGLSDALDSLGGVPDNLVNCSSLSYQDQGGNTVTPQLSSVLPDFDLFRYRSLFSPIPWAPNQDQYIYRCYTYNGRLYQKKSSDSNSGSVFNSGLYTLLGSAETINLSQVSGVGSLASLNSLGNISSSGAIGSSSGLLVVTTSNGTLTTSSGIDSSLISNFNSSVSGLLPVKNIIAGTGVSITSSSGIYTINSSSGSSSSSSSIDAGEYPLISISSQPSGISVAESSIATFSVTATAS